MTSRAEECCRQQVPKLDLTRQEGAEWKCPTCGSEWVYDIDEAEGSAWWPKVA